MPTILVRDALYRVSIVLNDAAPQFTRWTEKELVSYLNDAQKVIAKYMPHACSRIDSIKLVPGTRQSIGLITAANIKPGDGSTAVDVHGNMLLGLIRNMGADGLTPGRAIRIVDRDMLDASFPMWHSTSSVPLTEYTFDPRTPKAFYVSPAVPPAVATWVEASMLADPVDIPYAGSSLYGMASTNTTTISIDDKYIDDLCSYVTARAMMKDAEFSANVALAQAQSQMFVSSINAQVAALTGVNPNLSSLPFTPNIPAAAR
jgi:hypothetical protein